MKNTINILFSFILLISFSWQLVAKTVIYISFKSNQKALAETVCVNKEKPKSCCQAKCYLDKEIKKEDGRQNNLPSSLKDKIEKTELLSGYLKFNFSTDSETEKAVFYYSNGKTKSLSKKIFMPPKWSLFS